MEKSRKNLPVRRSERLSQKLNVSQPFSWNNMHITKTGRVFKTGCILCPSQRTQDFAKVETAKVNKCTQDIFSTEDLREDQELLNPAFYCKQYNISLNNNLNCNSESVKLIKAKKDVPLDLSNKSKVSIRETSHVEHDILNAANDLENCKVKNNIEEASHTIKGKTKRRRKPGRPKQICNKETIKEYLKKSTIDNLKPKETDVKLGQPFTTIQLLAEGNNKDLENHLKPEFQVKTSKVTHSKRKPRKNSNKTNKSDVIVATTKKFSDVQLKSSNNNNFNIEPSKTISVKSVKNNSSMESQPSELLSESIKNTFSSLILPNIQLKTSKVNHSKRKPRKASNTTINAAVIVATTKEFCDVQLQSSNNTNSNIEPSNSLISVKSGANISLIESKPSEFILKSTKRNSAISSICEKRFKSSNENITTNDLKNQTKLVDNTLKASNKPSIICQQIKILEKLENKADVNKSKIPNYKDIFEKPLNETKSIKRSQKMSINEKRNNTTVELEDFIQHIKYEPFTSSWEQKSIQTSLNNSNSNTNSTENINTMKTLTNKFHNNGPQIKSVACGNVKSQSTTAANKDKHNIKENIEIKKDIIYDNLKSKVNPLNSSYETQQIKTSQKSRLTRNSQKLSGEHTQKADTNTNVLKYQLEYGKANLKSSNETKKPKTFSCSEGNKKLDTNIKTTKVNKNYLKSFDKTLFLDKIQSSKSYSQTCLTQDCNYDKSNLMQIPPTPAESTQQDLLKKSILADVYPSHFKYQLTPGAVLTRSLDAQVITPDDTITSELLDSSSSSPSLPESLCELFQTKDIKDILNVEKVSYRLYDYHVQALALILNLRIEYLRKMLDKVMKIRPNVLKNIDKAVKMPFVPDCDLFATSPVESWPGSGDVVFNSQSPKQRRMSTIGDGIRC